VETGEEGVDGPLPLEPGRLCGVLDRTVLRLVGNLSLFQTLVVEPAVTLQGDCKLTPLVGVREQPVFEGPTHLLPPLALNVAADDGRADSAHRPGIVRP